MQKHFPGVIPLTPTSEGRAGSELGEAALVVLGDRHALAMNNRDVCEIQGLCSGSDCHVSYQLRKFYLNHTCLIQTS